MDIDELVRGALDRQAGTVQTAPLRGSVVRAQARMRRNRRATVISTVVAALVATGLFTVVTRETGTAPGSYSSRLDGGAVSNWSPRGSLIHSEAVIAEADAAARRPLREAGLGWSGARPRALFAGRVHGRVLVVLERRNDRGQLELGLLARAPGDTRRLVGVAVSPGSAQELPAQISALLGHLLVVVALPSVDSATWAFHGPRASSEKGKLALHAGIGSADLSGLPDQVWTLPRAPLISIRLVQDEHVVYSGPVGPLQLLSAK